MPKAFRLGILVVFAGTGAVIFQVAAAALVDIWGELCG